LHAGILANAKKFVSENFNIEKNYIYWENAIREIVGVPR